MPDIQTSLIPYNILAFLVPAGLTLLTIGAAKSPPLLSSRSPLPSSATLPAGSRSNSGESDSCPARPGCST